MSKRKVDDEELSAMLDIKKAFDRVNFSSRITCRIVRWVVERFYEEGYEIRKRP